MQTKLHLRGCISPCGTHLQCPLSSSVVLFIIEYCQARQFKPVFVNGDPKCDTEKQFVCSYDLKTLSHLDIEFSPWTDLTSVLCNVSLPSLHQADLCLVRSGLCGILRHIIKEAHCSQPRLQLEDLLGFRKGSMKMCAEVSGWTKLCEVDLGNSITDLIGLINTTDGASSLPLPLDLANLEGHFEKKCLVHNDDRKRRSELKRILKYFSCFSLDNTSSSIGSAQKQGGDNKKLSKNNDGLKDDTLAEMAVESVVLNKESLCIIYHIKLTHGIRKVKIERKLSPSSNTKSKALISKSSNEPSLETKLNDMHIGAGDSIVSDNVQTVGDKSMTYNCPDVRISEDGVTLNEAMSTLTYLDVEFVHVYSEGLTLTIADLILLTYIHRMVEALSYDVTCLRTHTPNLLRWAGHLMSLQPVARAGKAMGWSVDHFTAALRTEAADKKTNISFLKNENLIVEEDEFELSRNAKQKHRAIKPLVLAALNKVEEASIQAVTGPHPCGDKFTVNWDILPAGVHSKEGDVPEKRYHRKCQQLENLVTAVVEVARPGDVIIDFCSGGGHLGIAIAYLLPECQVYLVENKEESLLKSCSRLASLELANVTLYQCNIDYYIGDFDVGVCLHACGSATDMVLQLCLQVDASFVICPCCYGGIKNTHLLSYPRSDKFIQANLTYKDFLTLGHAADQTEFNIALETQGRQCMNLVDTDRAELARQHGYTVTLCSLTPLSCSPKNNLLVGALGRDALSS